MDRLISVVMGSRSDWQTMKYVADTLASIPIEYEVRIMSAQRTSNQLVKYAKFVEEKGVKVIIASSNAHGMAHLPNILTSRTQIPVFTVHVEPKTRNIKHSLRTLAKDPSGVPDRTFSYGRTGAINIAYMAANILANEYDHVREALLASRVQYFSPSLYSMGLPVSI